MSGWRSGLRWTAPTAETRAQDDRTEKHARGKNKRKRIVGGHGSRQRWRWRRPADVEIAERIGGIEIHHALTVHRDDI